VDVGSAYIRAEDPLQHHHGRVHRLGWGANRIQKHSIHHGGVAENGGRAHDEKPTDVVRKVDVR